MNRTKLCPASSITHSVTTAPVCSINTSHVCSDKRKLLVMCECGPTTWVVAVYLSTPATLHIFAYTHRAQVAGFASAWKLKVAQGTQSHELDDLSLPSQADYATNGLTTEAVADAVDDIEVTHTVGNSEQLEEPRPRVGPVRQLRLLLSRSWKQATRDKGTNVSRVGGRSAIRGSHSSRY